MYKRLVKQFFLYIGTVYSFLTLCFVVLCFIVDPLQIFHKLWFLPKDMLSTDMRAQPAGIINSYSFDSIILGTSVLANTSAAESGLKLGGTFFNISVPGSDCYERSFVLKKALKKNIHKVIYSMDDYFLSCRKGDSSFPPFLWKFLYDQNPFNDFFYYAHMKNIRLMFEKKKNFGLKKCDLDRPYAWFSESPSPSAMVLRLGGGLEKWAETMDLYTNLSFLFRSEWPEVAKYTETCVATVAHDQKKEYKLRKYLDTYLLKYIKEYPQTEFYCIFPPYFRYKYVQYLRLYADIFGLHHEMIKYMVEKSEIFPNLHVYGFEDQDFLDDINNYCDLIHYHPRYNSLILDAIRDGKHLLTPENLEQYLQDSLDRALKFDVIALNAEAQRLLREREVSQNKD